MKDFSTPRTTTDIVFDQLHADISSLKLLPGTKMSEAEVAARLGVSRQPVRDAFNRLGHLDLLMIRPQRATLVRGFSKQKIANARFVRLSIELEVMRRAHAVWDAEKAALMAANLKTQEDAVTAGDLGDFHTLDYDFHKMVFDQCGHALAFETVMDCKRQVDRLCVLSLANDAEAMHIFTDHQDIAAALSHGSPEDLETCLRRHLGRLDTTITKIEETHAEYFE